MRIAFAVNGTRGDVQPAAVLAHRLAERGHDVILGIPPNLGDAIAGSGMHVRRLGLDTQAQLDHVSRARAAAGRDPIKLQRMLAEVRDLGWAEIVGDMAGVVEGADVVVTGFTTEQVAAVYALRAAIPVISLHHAPIRPNLRVGPLPAIGARSTSLNRLQWALADRALTAITRRRDRELAGRVGGVPDDGPGWTRVRRAPGADIQAYDPMFAVHDDPVWDRDSRRRPRPVVGFLDLPGRLRQRMGSQMRGTASADVMSWIGRGEPPVYVGFGSMPLRDPAAVVGIVEWACRSVGRRALICAGWNRVDDMAAAVCDTSVVQVVDSIDHAVLTRCAVVVHHGGAGTTAAALRAGVPSVVCWFSSDQPFWGAEVSRLGVGVSLRFRKVDAKRLAAGLRASLDPACVERARAMPSALVGAQQAADHAADVVESSVRPMRIVA